MFISLKTGEIEAWKYKSAHFAKLFFFLLRENDKEQKVYIAFQCKLYLMKDVKANIYIRNNILNPEDFVLNIRLGHTIVRSCGVKIVIRV